jgi:hypothetical protein
MYRKELFFLAATAAGIFLAVAAVSSWMTWVLQHEARMVVVDTLPGLVNAGEALNRMDGNWERVRMLTELPLPVQRSNMIQQIQSKTTSEFWDRYQKAIFDPRDRQLFSATQAARSNCRTLAQQYFNLVNEQKLDTARQFFTNELEPSFNEYKGDAINLFQLNEQIGEKRSQRILFLSRWLPPVAGVFGIVVFALGFLAGLRGAFTGMDLIFKHRKQPEPESDGV